MNCLLAVRGNVKLHVTARASGPIHFSRYGALATEAWGPFGARVVEKWVEFNGRYFDGKLRPVPLVITHAQPFGKRLALCSYDPGSHGRTITLNVQEMKSFDSTKQSPIHDLRTRRK